MCVAQDQLRVAPMPEGQTALAHKHCALSQYKLRVARMAEGQTSPQFVLRVAPHA
ncbi:hypothetical protein A2U01_0066098, partial [Trifolium medium]|nr:hypothetical protein [Trifolium medium]